jgi:hypothetical protein
LKFLRFEPKISCALLVVDDPTTLKLRGRVLYVSLRFRCAASACVRALAEVGIESPDTAIAFVTVLRVSDSDGTSGDVLVLLRVTGEVMRLALAGEGEGTGVCLRGVIG